MSHEANDIIVENITETIDRIEGDLRKAWDTIDHMQPIVEAAGGLVDALHRLSGEIDSYLEWENDI